MKILYVVTGAAYGGAVAHVVRLIKADIRNRHLVGLISAPEKILISEIDHTGVRFFPNRYFESRVKLYNDACAIWPVFQAIRSFGPDIVSAHSTKAGYAARIACALLRKPLIFTAHGWAFSEGQSWLRRKLIPLAERAAALSTDRIICVSQYDLDLALRYKIGPPNKLVLVRVGIDPQSFLQADSSVIKQELGIKHGLVLTMVARFSAQKDPLTFLKACTLIKGDFKCVMVGEGELRREAEEFAARHGLGDKVIFTGGVKDVKPVLAASDILILASHWEGLPASIIEAGMAGLPSVASRVGGVSEVIRDGVTGFTVPPQDAPALAAALQTLIDDAGLRQQFGRAARVKMLREFSFDRMYQETQEVYREVLESRRKSRKKNR